MMSKYNSPIFIALMFIGSHATAIDCKKSTTAIDKLICNSPELLKQDEILNQHYQTTINKDQSGFTETEQRYWIRYVRNACKTQACLETAYQDRLTLMQSRLTKSGDTQNFDITPRANTNQAIPKSLYGTYGYLEHAAKPTAGGDWIPTKQVIRSTLKIKPRAHNPAQATVLIDSNNNIFSSCTFEGTGFWTGTSLQATAVKESDTPKTCMIEIGFDRKNHANEAIVVEQIYSGNCSDFCGRRHSLPGQFYRPLKWTK